VAKEVLGVVVAILTVVGYVPYVRDTINGRTRPHVYTWFVWALVGAIAFGLQVSGGAGFGSLGTLAATIVCLLVFGLGLRQGDRDTVASDMVFLGLSLVALVLWVFAKQPVASVILVSAVSLLGFVPTIRKSWNRPDQETLICYVSNTLRNGLGLAALQHVTLVTSLYMVTWLVANGAFSVLLVARGLACHAKSQDHGGGVTNRPSTPSPAQPGVPLPPSVQVVERPKTCTRQRLKHPDRSMTGCRSVTVLRRDCHTRQPTSAQSPTSTSHARSAATQQTPEAAAEAVMA